MERVFSNSTKIMIDQARDGTNSLMYLPIDQIMKQRATRTGDDTLLSPSTSGVSGGPANVGDSGNSTSGVTRPDRYSDFREGRG
jgi:hypothetical protein